MKRVVLGVGLPAFSQETRVISGVDGEHVADENTITRSGQVGIG